MKSVRHIFPWLVVILLLFTGCSDSLSAWDFIGKNQVPDPTRYITEFENNWRYPLLEESFQKCYGSLYTALTEDIHKDTYFERQDNDEKRMQVGISITLPNILYSMEEAQYLYDNFFHDNPQFFYVDTTFSLEGYTKNDLPHYTHIVLYYIMDAQKRATAKVQLENTITQWVSEAPDTTDQYITELYLHDRLADFCRYHKEAALTPGDYTYAYSAYGALVEGKAVCVGYAQGMKLLLNRVGIASTMVTGKSVENGENHVWNLVTVNGKNYHLDVTWDSSEYVHHSYFNITTKQLSLSHVMDKNQPGIDTCSAEEDNYHVRSGTYIDSYKRQTIAQAIANAAQRGETQIELRMAPDKYDNALLFLKNGSLTRQMVNAHLVDSGQVMPAYDLKGVPTEHILILRKK